MILKGSQRAGGTQLASHLLNDRDNDHVMLSELCGFVASDLHGALKESQAIAQGTKCKQYLFSLSLNPPKDAEVSEADFETAIEKAGKTLGLEGQPRAIVFHEKEGRRHAHVVWSRIDAGEMRAINMAHFKNKLTSLSRELYLSHGWELPNGLKPDGIRNPLNFNLDEWQRAKRQGVDPREIKTVFRDAWNRSDGQKAFANALSEYGYFLAKGDRRGFVTVDINGDIYSVPKYAGVKAKDARAKLGSATDLPSVSDVAKQIKLRVTEKLKSFIKDTKQTHESEQAPLIARRDALAKQHRAERARLSLKQKERWKEESEIRAQRIRNGFAGLVDRLTGKAKAIKQENRLEAFEGLRRDQMQRDALITAQMVERRALQKEFEKLRASQTQDRRILAREVMTSLRQNERLKNAQEKDKNQRPDLERPRRRKPGFSLDR